ncbi:MAG TPA: Ku protein [Polyangia bacterium]|jgi:DNA end-binding protein Ku|nr:Ku protein [Polyangia bacterium]
MARAIAGGTISFGLVSIPVKLYSATQASAGISFHLLHAKDNTRLKQQYICPRDNEIVPRDEMIKGYEFAKDQYVTFSGEELKALEEKATQTIEIAEFVPMQKIDPVYFDKPYYLGAEKGGEKAYHLLCQAMRDTGRCGLARYAARGKQYLVLLRPTTEEPGGLVMQQLLYADEVRPFSDVPIAEADVREPELKLAKQLIDQIAVETFDPTQFEDDVRKRTQEDIDRKVKGQEISAAEPAPEPARIIDLMEALKASLSKKGQDNTADAEEGADSGDGHVGDRRSPRRSAPRAEKTEGKRARGGKR